MIGDQVALFCGERMTKREILIARHAFEQGAEWMFAAGDPWAGGMIDPADSRRKARRLRAEQAFPIPTITRPRVLVDDTGVEYKVEDGRLYWRTSGTGWYAFQHSVTPTSKRVPIWNALFACPTETVEDDERVSTPAGRVSPNGESE